MTRSQIQFVLSELNTQFAESGTLYGEGLWLAMDEVSSINLLSNESIYPDETMHVFFDGTNQLVRLGKGYYENGSFVVEKVESITMYSQVMSFLLHRPTRMKSPYRVSSAI
jgi:hypothetical protein